MTPTVAITESRLQAEIFQYHWNHYPNERGLLFHVNNKARNAIEGNKMAAMGVVKGVSDLIYLCPGGKPVLIELKLWDGKISKEQVKWQATVQRAGYSYMILRSLQEFITYLTAQPAKNN